jgi:peptidoglycan/xylan/chitin deacetylase (PgdA/CDA1 family)
MKIVSPLLKRVVYPCLAGTGYLHRRTGRGDFCVVTYHGVLPHGYRLSDTALDGSLVSAHTLRGQFRLLKTRYNVISPEQWLAWCEDREELPPRAILLTCDDGLQNALTDMLPILQEEELPCLFFVTAASVEEYPQMLWYEELYLMLLKAADWKLVLKISPMAANADSNSPDRRREFWWKLVQNLSQCDHSSRRDFMNSARFVLQLTNNWNAEYSEETADRHRFFLMASSGLKQLAAAGMTIGAHTLSHPILSQLPAESAWKEISECRHLLENTLGKPVWALAYPFGDSGSVTQREWEMAQRAGYKCAFLNFGGGFGAHGSRYAVPRVHVTADMEISEFEAHVSGFYQGLRRRMRMNAPISAVAEKN